MSKYITIGPFCWGKADNSSDSYYNCLRECSSARTNDKTSFTIFKVSDDSYVNEMGGFTRPKDDPSPIKEVTITVTRQLVQAWEDATTALEDEYADGCKFEYHDNEVIDD